MRGPHIVMVTGAAVLASALAVACGQVEKPLALVVETGCVTGSPAAGEYILTDLENPGLGEPRPVTEAYVLRGDRDELREQAGRRVRVTGEVEPSRVVDIRLLEPLVRPKAPADDVRRALLDAAEPDRPQAGDPRIKIDHAVRLEVSDLWVRAIDDTGERCESM